MKIIDIWEEAEEILGRNTEFIDEPLDNSNNRRIQHRNLNNLEQSSS